MTLKLRDIEVANDDFEKQARHQTSSLEDMESKYNKAIERGVLLDEEIKNGEQERETLRIETQRLRDELSDLKVEQEITMEKLRVAEEGWAAAGRKPSGLHTNIDGLRSASPTTASEAGSTSATTISSPTVTTPPPKSETSTVQTSPPSPPLSEAGTTADAKANANANTKAKLAPITPANKRTLEPGATPRPLHSSIRPPRHSRGPSIPTASSVRQQGPTSAAPKRTTARPSVGGRPSLSGLPQPTSSAASRSESLYQIRGMRKKLTALEERVQSARSKLPAPTSTPPRASPRAASDVLSNVTVRSSRKRPSTTAGSTAGAEGPASRLSFGFNPGASVHGGSGGDSRPSSRASMTSGVPRPSSRASGIARPPSQSSMRTPSSLGYYPQSERRPRSSVSGNYAAVHGGRDPQTPSLSRSEYGSRAGTPLGSRHAYSRSIVGSGDADTSLIEEGGDDGGITPTARRTTIGDKGSAIPGPARRQSTGLVRRQSNLGVDGGGGGGEMLPPASTQKRERKNVDVGETF